MRFNLVNNSIIGSICLINIIIIKLAIKNISEDTESGLGNAYLKTTVGIQNGTIIAIVLATMFPKRISLFTRNDKTHPAIHNAARKGVINNAPPKAAANPLPPLNPSQGLKQ